jgi:ABC-type nitrate/sulfonate/bicarbonate transport system permease component
MRVMRAYHHFSTRRNVQHLLISFLILFVPLVLLSIFSYGAHIPIRTAFTDLFISSWRLVCAFLIASILGWLLVVTFVRGKTENAALAIFDVMQSLPTFTILPLAVHFLGNNERTIIFFLALTIIWPIVFTIVSSLKQVDRAWSEATRMTRIKGFDYIRYYLFPVTAPGLVTGAIIGLGDGWEALIATEIILNLPDGLGTFFQTFSSNTMTTFFGVLVFLAIIFSINKLVWLPLLDRTHELIEE